MGWCHNHHGYNLPLAIRYRLEHGIPLSAHAEPIRRVLYIAPRKNIPGVGENGCPHGKLTVGTIRLLRTAPGCLFHHFNY